MYFALCLWSSRGEAGTQWGGGEGGDAVTPISRHYIYVPPNRVQCIFFLPLAHPLSVEKRYMHSLLKFDSGTGLVFSPFLSRLNEFQGKLM